MMEGGSSRRGGSAERVKPTQDPVSARKGQHFGKGGVCLELKGVGSGGRWRMSGTLATRLSSEPKQKSKGRGR